MPFWPTSQIVCPPWSWANVCEGPALLTFQVRRPHSGHSRGRGLAEALEGGLLPGGVVRRAVLLLLLFLVRADGLQGQLFPARDKGYNCISEGGPACAI